MFNLIPSSEEQILEIYRNSSTLARQVRSNIGKTLLIGFRCKNGSWVRFSKLPSIVLDDAGYAKLFALERQNEAVTTFAVHY